MSVSITAAVVTVGIEGLMGGMVARIEAVIATYAELIANRTRELAPERTGADKATVHAILAAMMATISIGEGLHPEYGVFQEMGFRHYKSHAFIQNPALRPALEQYAQPFLEAVRAAVLGA